MAVIKPFKGIRPTRDKAHLVASRAVNTYKPRLLNAKLEENPYTFLHVILPEHGQKATTKPNTTERFKLVKKQFQHFVKQGILIEDKKPCLYLYRQVKGSNVYMGIIGGSGVEDYNKGVICIHEQTLTKREEVFRNYLDVCGFNAEPVLLAYENISAIDKLCKKISSTRPEFEFTTSDKITHCLWVIDKKTELEIIQSNFKKLPAVYIADGHHRSSSSALLAAERKKKNKKHTGTEMYNFCMSLFMPVDQMRIYEFNRLVKSVNGMSDADIISKLKERFSVTALTSNKKPAARHIIHMFLSGKWYKLEPNKGLFNPKHPVESLDAQIVTDHILGPVFGITDLKTDPRVGFAGGHLGASYLENQINNKKSAVAFALYPVSFKELKAVADNKLIMPPKSTWVEPKLRSGLVIQNLEE
ncbi:MAG: DUF1015 domain-containing protein [Flavobacteriales bacterium]